MVVLVGIAFAPPQPQSHQVENGVRRFQNSVVLRSVRPVFPVLENQYWWLFRGVQRVIDYGNDNITFVFGGLNSDQMFEVFGGSGFVFAIRVLPVIIFFSSLIAVLYHIGIMQWVINVLGGLRKALGTSVLNLSATANIFMGQTETPLVVRPFIKSMTSSELFAVMVGGLASVQVRCSRATLPWECRWNT